MLAHVVAEAARRFGDRPAIVAEHGDGCTLTYADLGVLVPAVAAGLAARGVGEHDIVAGLLPSSPEHLVLQMAAAHLGAVLAAVSPRSTVTDRSAALEVLRPALVVGTDDLLDRVPTEDAQVVAVGLADGPDGLLHELRPGPGSATSVPRPVAEDPERIAAIVFTSGTTGRPKAAVFHERQLQSVCELDLGPGWQQRWGGGAPMLVSTELCHVGVSTKLAWYLRLGSTLHLLRRWRADAAIEVLQRTRAPVIGAIVPQLALLIREPGVGDLDWRHVTTLIGAGAPSNAALIRAAREIFGADYSVRYSSTESGGLGTVTAKGAHDDELFGTVGRPRPGVEVEIRDGEVWLRSPTQMSGYLRDDAATSRGLVDGWLRTGDVGHLDPEGRLVLEGRSDDVYLRGGYNVSAGRVAQVLASHPAIAEVAVAPRADAVLGSIGVAVVVVADGCEALDLEELRRFAAPRLAHHELPEAFVTVAALPLTAMHKLDRVALRALTAVAQSSRTDA